MAIDEIQEAQTADYQSTAAPAAGPPDEVAQEAIAPGEQASVSLRGARDFWLVWSGQSVSMLGDGLYGIAMAW